MTMANPNLLVAWTADKPPMDPFNEEVENRRTQWRKNLAGIEVLKSWLSLGNGTLVDVQGTDGTMEIVPDALAELKRTFDQFIQTVGYTVSVGVGNDMGDSERARIVASHRGGDRMILWSEEMYPELKAAEESGRSDEYDEYGDFLGRSEGLADVWTESDFVELAKMTRQPLEQLLKSDFTPEEQAAFEETPMAGGQSAPAYARAGAPPVQPSRGASPGGGDVPPDATTAGQAPENNLQPGAPEPQTHEEAFHQHAQAADADDQATQSPQRQQIKQAVVQVLKQVAPQLKQLDGLRNQAPEAYEGVLAVIQAMAVMAQALNGEEPAVPEQDKEGGESGQESGQNGPKEEKSDEGKKTEKSEKDLFAEAAFLHKPSGKTIATGSHHDLNQIDPEAYDRGEYSEGFVDHSGKFFTREQAHTLVHGAAPGPDEDQLQADDLFQKDALHFHHTGHDQKLAVGTVNDGKIKVKHGDGTTSWKSVRAGIVMSPDGHAVSSRNPGGK